MTGFEGSVKTSGVEQVPKCWEICEHLKFTAHRSGREFFENCVECSFSWLDDESRAPVELLIFLPADKMCLSTRSFLILYCELSVAEIWNCNHLKCTFCIANN